MNNYIGLIIIQSTLAVIMCVTALEENELLSACSFFSACAAVEGHNMFLYSKGRVSKLRIVKPNATKEAKYLCHSIIASLLCCAAFLIYGAVRIKFDIPFYASAIAFGFNLVSYIMALDIKKKWS